MRQNTTTTVQGINDLAEVISIVGAFHAKLNPGVIDLDYSSPTFDYETFGKHGIHFLDQHGLESVSPTFSNNARLCWGVLWKIVYMDIEENLVALERGTLGESPMLSLIADVLDRARLKGAADPNVRRIQDMLMGEAFSFYLMKGLQMAFEGI